MKDIKALIFRLLHGKRKNARIFLSNFCMKIIFALKGIKCGKNISFNGITYFYRRPESSISIGDSCRFNSAKRSVTETLLYKPCSISTTRPGTVLKIGKNVGATSANIICVNQITIGNNTLIGANCIIIDSDMHHSDPYKRLERDIPAHPVDIGENVFLGFNCTVLKGVKIGANSVIGVNSVVLKNIPPN